MNNFLYLLVIAALSLIVSCGKVEINKNIEAPYTPDPTFQWVLSELPKSDKTFDYIDIDGFDASAEDVATLKATGAQVIGYISVGSWEDWRSDKDDFPDAVIGKRYDGWAGEKWLDISNLDKLGPILEKRLDMLVEKGFDGIEPDNLDGYEAKTGFDLSEEDALNFCKWLISAAHERGLTIGQKNVPEFTDQLVDEFNWALIEDAYIQGWEGDLKAYTTAGKPVFMVEYTDESIDANEACIRAQELGYTFLLKNRDLDEWYMDCRGAN